MTGGVSNMQHIVQPEPATYAAVRRINAGLTAKYPFLCEVPLGQSLCGREISALMLCCPGKEPTGRVLFAAAFHGQEWITSLIILRFCEEICYCLQNGLTMTGVDVRRALAGRTLIIVPQVNPDGVEIALGGSATAGEYAKMVAALGGDDKGLWQANARGVDINHNFDAGFDTACESMPTAPAPRRYRGEQPESEPETKLLCALCRRISFRHVTALHTQGEEIYWQYGEHTPVPSRMMAEIMASAAGYKTQAPTGSAAFGGFKDWFIDCFHRPGFTIEMGRGINPLPLTDFSDISNKVREMLLLDAML